MWLLGKVFWFFAILPPLAEAWHPGVFGSWLMIPAIFTVIYGDLACFPFERWGGAFKRLKVVSHGRGYQVI